MPVRQSAPRKRGELPPRRAPRIPGLPNGIAAELAPPQPAPRWTDRDHVPVVATMSGDHLRAAARWNDSPDLIGAMFDAAREEARERADRDAREQRWRELERVAIECRADAAPEHVDGFDVALRLMLAARPRSFVALSPKSMDLEQHLMAIVLSFADYRVVAGQLSITVEAARQWFRRLEKGGALTKALAAENTRAVIERVIAANGEISEFTERVALFDTNDH